MKRILIVKDSLLQGKIVSDSLIDHGFEINLAVTGEDAIQKITTKAFDLILTDRVLPDISGVHLIKKIKQLPNTANLLIIVLSGVTDKENVIESLGLGIHDYLTKPYHAKELMNRINIHLCMQRM